MARGGYRPGAGRPRKTGTAKAIENAAVAAKADEPVLIVKADTGEAISPLDFLLSIVRDDRAAVEHRFRAAVAAAPYVHPRAGDVAKGKKEQQQEAAEKAATGKFAPRSGPRLVKG